jgi:hypothetical protein
VSARVQRFSASPACRRECNVSARVQRVGVSPACRRRTATGSGVRTVQVGVRCRLVCGAGWCAVQVGVRCRLVCGAGWCAVRGRLAVPVGRDVACVATPRYVRGRPRQQRLRRGAVVGRFGPAAMQAVHRGRRVIGSRALRGWFANGVSSFAVGSMWSVSDSVWAAGDSSAAMRAVHRGYRGCAGLGSVRGAAMQAIHRGCRGRAGSGSMRAAAVQVFHRGRRSRRPVGRRSAVRS